MVRTNEGGSILSFVVVGAILTVLLLGSVYTVKQYFVSGQKPPAAERIDTPAATDKKPSSEGRPSTGSPSTDEKVPASPVEEAPAPGVETLPGVDAAPKSNEPVATELPQTGPAESMMSLLAVALLGGSAVAYLRSRRYLLSSPSI